MLTHDMPLLLVALIVFAGVFAFLWRVDARTNALERELREEIELDRSDERARS